MRKYFFSAMALVLGLFTVTAVFAFTIIPDQPSSTSLIYSYPASTDTGWNSSGNWNATEPTEPCLVGELPCRIDLSLTEFTDLQLFLNQFQGDYDAFLEHDAVETKD